MPPNLRIYKLAVLLILLAACSSRIAPLPTPEPSRPPVTPSPQVTDTGMPPTQPATATQDIQASATSTPSPTTAPPLPIGYFPDGAMILPFPGIVARIEADGDPYQRVITIGKELQEMDMRAYQGRDLLLSHNHEYGLYGEGWNGNLWLLNLSNGQQIQLTNLPEPRIYDPVWSPDDMSIAFFNHGDVYVVDTKTQELRNLTNTPDRWEGLFLGWWSARPDMLFFGSDVSSHNPPIGFPGRGHCHTSYSDCFYYPTSVKIDGSEYQIIDSLSGLHAPADLSPDGKTLAYDGGRLYDLDTKQYTILQPGDFGIDPKPIVFSDGPAMIEPRWSPDGKRIVWTGHGIKDSPQMTYLYLLDFENNSGKVLVEFQQYFWNLSQHPSNLWGGAMVSWSPNGEWIIIETVEYTPGRWHSFANFLRVFSREGSLVQEYEGDTLFDIQMVWSPDSRYFIINDPGRPVLIHTDDWSIDYLYLPWRSEVIDWIEIK